MAGGCAPETCPVPGGFLDYQPSVAGNAFMLAAFAILVPVTLFLGYRFRTPVFASTLATGLLLEILGFVGRVMLRGNVADKTYFALFLLGTVLGPTCISASTFLILPHIMSVYGERACSIRPAHVGAFFASFSILAGVIQLVGVIFAAFGFGTESTRSTTVLVGGLGVQATTLLLFIATHFWFMIGLNGQRVVLDIKHAAVYQSSRFKRFLLAMQAAVVLLLGYTIYRLVETVGGLGGALAQNEVTFMAIDAAVPLLACIILTVVPPGAAFSTAWAPTSPRFKARRPPPPPLRSPMAPYDRYRQQRANGHAAKYTTTRIAPAKHSPLRSSTITSQQATKPTQPSPIAQSHKISPTFPLGHPLHENTRDSARKSGAPRGNLVDSETLW